MKAESNIKPTNFEIENIQKDRCDIVLYDNIQEVTEEENIKYTFDIYRLNICYHKDIAKDIENDIGRYIEIAKNKEYKILAAEIRNKRDELLKQTDAEMCLDRLGLEMPEGTSFTAWITFLKTIGNAISGRMAKYRQELRDITKQEGFPYNVKWPDKEDLKK